VLPIHQAKISLKTPIGAFGKPLIAPDYGA
jgi:hypothetical protein